jgi:hypothetical protein
MYRGFSCFCWCRAASKSTPKAYKNRYRNRSALEDGSKSPKDSFEGPKWIPKRCPRALKFEPQAPPESPWGTQGVHRPPRGPSKCDFRRMSQVAGPPVPTKTNHHTTYYILYTMHHILYTIHLTPYTIHYTPYIIHHTLCTIHTIHYALCTMWGAFLVSARRPKT